MNQGLKTSICRCAEQERLINLLAKDLKRTQTARKMIMTELLREELSAKYLVKHG